MHNEQYFHAYTQSCVDWIILRAPRVSIKVHFFSISIPINIIVTIIPLLLCFMCVCVYGTTIMSHRHRKKDTLSNEWIDGWMRRLLDGFVVVENLSNNILFYLKNEERKNTLYFVSSYKYLYKLIPFEWMHGVVSSKHSVAD